jgi:integrase
MQQCLLRLGRHREGRHPVTQPLLIAGIYHKLILGIFHLTDIDSSISTVYQHIYLTSSPFCTSRIYKRRDEKRLYHNAEARISYHLRKLGVKIGIKGKLTLYVARHSWATAARDNQIPISVISEALGHHSEITTQIYLRSIKSSEVDDANAKILAVL